VHPSPTLFIPACAGITAVVDKLPTKTKAASSGIGAGNGGPGDDVIEGPEPRQTEMTFFIDEFSRAIVAKIVKKCGTRDYWEDWSASIAEIAKNHIIRLTALLTEPLILRALLGDAEHEEAQLIDFSDGVGYGRWVSTNQTHW
jgi:hypothetical protein